MQTNRLGFVQRVNRITLLPFSGARKDGFASLSLQEKGPGAEQPQKQGCVGGMDRGGAKEDMKDFSRVMGSAK